MPTLISAHDTADETGITGLQITYSVGDDIRALWLSASEIDGLTPAQIKTLAQSRADLDTGLAGASNEREDILVNDIKGMLATAQAEIDYLDTTIPTIDAMTATQVRSVVKRLSQENRQIIKALIRLAYRVA